MSKLQARRTLQTWSSRKPPLDNLRNPSKNSLGHPSIACASSSSRDTCRGKGAVLLPVSLSVYLSIYLSIYLYYTYIYIYISLSLSLSVNRRSLSTSASAVSRLGTDCEGKARREGVEVPPGGSCCSWRVRSLSSRSSCSQASSLDTKKKRGDIDAHAPSVPCEAAQ